LRVPILMKTVVLTGFEPFGGDRFNPSGEIARQLDGAIIAAHKVTGAVLPCVFGIATTELNGLLELYRPVLVICLGLAAGRTAITPEAIAVNLVDARIADNHGQQPVNEPVVPGAPASYRSRLPITAIAQALQAHAIPAEVSQSAGTFVCNHLFYGLMHALAQARSSISAGFIHIPALSSGAAGQPGLPLDVMTAGIALAIETSLQMHHEKTLYARISSL
jgi:pyroglutamyl-peptidase